MNKPTKNNGVKKKAKADFEFENKLEQFSKKALAMTVAQIMTTEVNRGWLLEYLDNMEGLLDKTGVNDQSLQDSIFHAIRTERKTQDEINGPVQVNPRTITEWTDRLARLITKAHSRAGMGQELAALKMILWIARDAVACMEDRIDGVAEHHKDSLNDAINKVLQHPEDNIDALLELGTGNGVDEDAEIGPEVEIGPNGIQYCGHQYWASWMADRQGEKVRVKMPSDPRTIIVVKSPYIHHEIGQASRMNLHSDNGEAIESPANKTADDADTSPAG